MIFDSAEHKLKPLANDVAVKFMTSPIANHVDPGRHASIYFDGNAMFSLSKNIKAPVILSTEKKLQTEQQTDSGQNVYI